MNTNRITTKNIALCGVMAALSSLCMVCGGFLPLATFIAPALAGILLVPAAVEIGYRNGYWIYAIVGAISLLIVPEKEMAFLFIFFFGYYPILKAKLEKLKKPWLVWLVKFSIFNVSVIGLYALLIFVFKLDALVNDFKGTTNILLFVFVIIANVTFYVFDIALSRLVFLYMHKYRRRINKSRIK
ncbi:MAG: hypothetical protein RR052_00500 [Oscillospiraceae bacterium]